MTEIDWQTTPSGALEMLRFVRTRTTARKLQLVMCAACRLVLDHLPTERATAILNGVELYADGLAPLETFRQAEFAAQRMEREAYEDTLPGGESQNMAGPRWAAILALRAAVSSPLDDAMSRTIVWVESAAARDAGGQGLARAARIRRQREICDLFREVIPNPFSPRVAVPTWMQAAERPGPGWLVRISTTARILAESIQTDQAYDRYPLLADALEEEGCADIELLLHLRQPAKHVRGCWALDLVLGKT